jgi:hypothetical protein
MLLLGVVQAQAAGDVSFGSYDLLATEILTTTTASVTFSSLNTLAAGYQHLQLRAVVTTVDNSRDVFIRFNSDTGNNYTRHHLVGNGSSVASGASINRSTLPVFGLIDGTNSSIPSAIVSDILDPFESTKFKTVRSLSGRSATEIELMTGLWRNTDPVTSLTVLLNSSSFNTGSRISLYGIKAV